jgi:hypothetical protein
MLQPAIPIADTATERRHRKLTRSLTRTARRLVKAVTKTLKRRTYWRRRSGYRYYAKVVGLARKHAPSGGSVIDVGAHESRTLADLTWFERRVALDRQPIPKQRGIERVQVEFRQYRPTTRFDLVLCLQVLEHLHNPAGFARRLFECGSVVILSVPYKWPQGKCRWHVQDPVTKRKLREWTGRDPSEVVVVRDPNARLIAVYRPEDAPPPPS